jgi:hypothetical protein
MLPSWMLKYEVIIVFFAVTIVALAIYAQVILKFDINNWAIMDDDNDKKEGFETIPIAMDPKDATKIKPGYYRINSELMAAIPYGYRLSPVPADGSKIIPITNPGMTSVDSEKIPSAGDMLPDGYYLQNANALGILPPNMMPKVDSISFDYGGLTAKVKIFYSAGYVSEKMYYDTEFPVSNVQNGIIPPGPPGVYFTNPSKSKVRILPYGKIADKETGYGMIDDPNLIMTKTGQTSISQKSYRDILNDPNNYDVQYHATPEELKQQNDFYDTAFNEVRVKDKSGKIISLPFAPGQTLPTYYQPGSFPFGSSTYIPKYEDSVYLSRTTGISTLAPYKSALGPKGKCELSKDFPAKQEEYCRSVPTDQCASASCCVLLGGEKCVAGNEQGPLFKANYSDFLLKNKDTYYANGKCFGNC